MNKIIVSGRIVKDIELKYTKNQKAVVKNTVAVNRKYDRDTADFFNVVLWEKTAEFANNYLGKGCRVVITGRMETQTWETEGEKKFMNEIQVEDLEATDFKEKKEQQSKKDKIPDFVPPEDGDDDELPF